MPANATLPLALLIEMPVLDEPPVTLPEKVTVLLVVESTVTTRWALFCTIDPAKLTVGEPPLIWKAIPVGLVIAVLAPKLNEPEELLMMSTPASPPFRMVVPRKL